MDDFSLLCKQSCVYSYLVTLLLHRIGTLLAYAAAFCYLFDDCLAFVAERAGTATPNFEVADSNHKSTTLISFTNSRVISVLFAWVENFATHCDYSIAFSF